MFENLVDCAKNRPTNRRWAFFAVTAIAWALALTASLIGGILLYDARLDEQLSMLTMLQPMPPPPPPPPAGNSPHNAVQKPQTKQYADVPTKETPKTIEMPTDMPVKRVVNLVKNTDLDAGGIPGGSANGVPGGVVGGFDDGVIGGAITDAPPPPPKEVEKIQPVEDTKPATPSIIRRSEGVIQGNAVNRVTPDYPDLAKRSNVSGEVRVDIVIGERGEVISARAVSGHPTLQAAALRAAKQWKFNPTMLNGVPVKVEGILTFRFFL